VTVKLDVCVSDTCRGSQRPKQRLLYNLLDAMQSTSTQSAVVGLSCRLVSAIPNLLKTPLLSGYCMAGDYSLKRITL